MTQITNQLLVPKLAVKVSCGQSTSGMESILKFWISKCTRQYEWGTIINTPYNPESLLNTKSFSVWFKLKKLRIATFHSPLQFWIIQSKRHTHLDSNLQNGGHVQCRLVCYNLLVQCLLFLISSTNILGTTGHSCKQITSRMEKCILLRTKFATINFAKFLHVDIQSPQ